MSFTNADIELQFVDTNILLYAYDRSAGNKFTVDYMLFLQISFLGDATCHKSVSPRMTPS